MNDDKLHSHRPAFDPEPMARPWRLNLVLPLVMGGFLLLAICGGLLQEYRRQLSELERNTETHFRTELMWLSDMAATNLHTNPSEVSRRLAYLSADPRVQSAALLDATTRVMLAHRRSWTGHRMSELLPGFGPEQVLPTLTSLQPELRWSPDHLSLRAMQGFRLRDGHLNSSTDPNDAANTDATPAPRMVIYLDVDLRSTRAQRLEMMWRNRWVELLGVAAGLLLLATWLQRRLVRPLLELRHGARRWAAGDLAARVAPKGVSEVADLARTCNEMAAALSQAQAAARASEERLSTILYSTGDAMLATDPQQRITLLNRVGEALTGWTEAQALGRPVEEVFKIENAQTHLPALIPIARVLAEGKVVGLANHTVLVARDGRRTHIADSAAPIRRGDGSLAGVVMVFRDVNEAYRLEQALADSEHHYRALANAGRALLWTTDPHGNSLWFNEPWLQFTGWPVHDAHTTTWRRLIHPDDLATLQQQWRLLQQQLLPLTQLLRLLRRDGQFRWMLLDGSPRRSPTGELIGFLLQAVDVSEQREVDERLQTQLDELRRWHAMTLDREQRVIDLKQEVNALLAEQGAAPRYAVTQPTPGVAPS